MRKLLGSEPAVVGCCSFVVVMFFGASSGLSALMTVEAVDDNFIRGGTYESTVQGSGGSSDTLVLRGDSNAENVRVDYARFDLSGLNPDAASSAKFSFTFLNGSGGGTGVSVAVWALNSGAAGYDWSESTIHWNNAPARSGANINEFNSDATKLIASVWVPYTTGEGAIKEVTIPTLGDYLQADNSVTIMMGAGRNGSGSLLTGRLMNAATSEHATYNGPQLEFNQVPEPSSFCLVSLGISGLIGGRRRRK
jgi:hypothetical protein